MNEYWYAFQFKIGCKTINFFYRGPGDKWDPDKPIGPFDMLPIGLGSRTEEKKRQNELEARARRGPEFVIEQLVQYRDDDGRYETEAVKATADRATLEDLRDALDKLLDYDEQIREEWKADA